MSELLLSTLNSLVQRSPEALVRSSEDDYRAFVDSVAERICHFPEVRSVALMSGGFDLAITVECSNMRDVAFFVAEKLATLEDVISTSTHFMLRKYKDNNVIYGAVPVDERGNII